MIVHLVCDLVIAIGVYALGRHHGYIKGVIEGIGMAWEQIGPRDVSDDPSFLLEQNVSPRVPSAGSGEPLGLPYALRDVK